MTTIIEKPLTRFRTTPAKGATPKVDREGGMYGAGMISGAAAITRGEALGHGAWVDSFAVDSVVKLGNRSPRGIKVRFTHPGLSADGMGTLLGRMKNFRREGERAVGDIHFARTAHNTPDGDLAEYVMNMADEDPEAFGMSIVFDHDHGEENRFDAEHQNEDGYFQSPDNDNSSNYQHIRLAKLWASDVVDEPAANPAGLFRAGHEIADEADRLCEYALGLTTERPTLQHLSVDSERLAQYAARFLDSHSLVLEKKQMTATQTAPAGITAEQLGTQLSAFSATLLSTIDEKIAAALKPADPPKLTEAQLQAQGVERFTKFREVAATAGLKDPDAVAKSWFDKGLNLEQLQASITPMLVNQNPLTTDTGEQPADPLAKYKAEYAAGRATFEAMGVSEAQYTASRKVDERGGVHQIGAAA